MGCVAPAPEATEAPAPEATEEPAPEAEETPAPEATEAPAPVTIAVKRLKDARVENGAAKFVVSAEASDGSALAYQWQQLDDSVRYKNETDRAEAWQDLKHETKKTLAFDGIADYAPYAKVLFRCRVTAGDVVVYTEEVKLLAPAAEEAPVLGEQTPGVPAEDVTTPETEAAPEAPATEIPAEEQPVLGEQTEDLPAEDGEAPAAPETEDATQPELPAEPETEEAPVTEQPAEDAEAPAETGANACAHAPVFAEATAPTCTEAGTIARWTCTACGASFAEETCETALTEEDLTVPPVGHELEYVDLTEGEEPTEDEFNEGDITEYWFCTQCGKYFADAEATGELEVPTGVATLELTETLADDAVASGTCGANGDNLTWSVSADGVLTISGTGAMADFVDQPWNGVSFSSVVIESGVTSIGASAFEGFLGVTSVSMPQSITSIGANAFSTCTGLTRVTIPAGVSSVGNWAFMNCTGLTEVVFNAGASVVGYGMFSGCTSLADVTLPGSVKTIAEVAFRNCTALTELVLPDGVTSIGGSAFDGCANLAKLTLPKTLTTVGSWAFDGCNALTEIRYTGTEAQWTAFAAGLNYENQPLLSATVTTTPCEHTYGDDHICTQCGALAPGYTVVANGTCGDDLTWTLTDNGTLTISGTGAMTDFSSSPWVSENVVSVVVEAGVTSIGQSAFGNCRSIESVSIASGVTSIGKWAFNGCSALTGVTIPGSVRTIDEVAFSGCSALTTLVISDGVTTIGGSAFDGCSALANLTLPKTLTTLGSYAFSGCSALTEVTYTGTEAQWAAFTAGLNYENTEVLRLTAHCAPCEHVFGDDHVCTLCGNYDPEFVAGSGSCGYDGENLTWLLTVDGVLTISGMGLMASFDAAPWQGKTLTSVVIGSNVMSIGANAFSGCAGLTSVTIPESVSSIGENAFLGCTALSDVHYPGTEMQFKSILLGYGNNALTAATLHCKPCEHSYGEDHTCTICGASDPAFTLGSGTCGYDGDNLTWILTADGKLTVSGTGAMANYPGYGSDEVPWKAFENALTQVVVEDGVTTIGDYAFAGYHRINKISIADSVSEVGTRAFAGCTGLADANGLVTVRGVLYGYAGTNTNVTISADVRSVDTLAFAYGSVESVTFAEGTTSIGAQAFQGCADLRTLHLPDSLTILGSQAFEGCTALTELTVPKGVKIVGDWAFARCTALTDVTFAAGATTLGEAMFSGCIALKNVTLAAGTKTIAPQAFEGCTALTEIELPAGVATVSGSAFCDCTGLTRVKLPVSLTTIADSAFGSCAALTEVCYAGTEEQWAQVSVGSDNAALTGATVVYNWCDHVFDAYRFCAKCSRYEEGYLGAGPCGAQGDNLIWTLTEDGTLTISGTGEMVDYPDYDDEVLGRPWDAYRSAIRTLTIEPGVTSIGGFAFMDCAQLKTVTIPSGVMSIVDGAFCGCSSLTSVTLPDALTSIGSWAFEGCSGLTSINIPDSVTRIGDSAFRGCDGLADENGLVIVNSVLYDYCGTATSVTIPSGVTFIGYEAFSGYTGIRSVTIPQSVWGIDELAFSGCTGLTSVTIPSGVKMIFSAAFSRCTGLTSVTIAPGVTAIGGDMFVGCTSLKSVSIPVSVTSIYMAAFLGCDALTDVYYAGTEEQWNAIDIDLDNDALLNAAMHYEWCDHEYDENHFCAKCGRFDPAFITDGGICGDDLTWTLTSDGILSIVGTGAIESAPWRDFRESIRKVVIDPRVTYINRSALSGCTNMTYLSMPATASSDSSAFSDCSGLTEIVLTGNGPMKGFAMGSYSSPWGAARANKPRVTIAEGVTSIAGCVFECCDWITEFTVPASVTRIEGGAFIGCTGLTQITILSNTLSIGNRAFTDCTGLKRVDTPSAEAWLNIRFENEESNPLTFAKNLYVDGTLVKNIVVPQGVTEIGAYAFSNCTSLLSVDFGNITSIGDNAFYGCKRLVTLRLPEGLTSIGQSAFEGGERLSYVYLPASLQVVGTGAFLSCPSIVAVHTPDLAAWLGTDFSGDGVLGSGNPLEHGGTLYINGEKPRKVTIPAGIETIPAYAFANCDELVSVEIPAGVRTVGNGAFWDCDSLQLINVGPDVESIGYRAFASCGWGIADMNVKFVFTGSAPDIEYDAFASTTAIVVYPQNDPTWTEEVRRNYLGELTWVTGEGIRITYALPEGATTDAPDVYYAAEGTVKLPGAVRPGYTFLGWYREASCIHRVGELVPTIQTDLTLYPQWQASQYTVTYVLNGGTQNAQNTGTYTAAGRTLYAPSRKYCSFLGWFSDPTLTDRWSNIPEGTTGNITLYAGWKFADYTITYNLNGGENDAENPATYNYITSVALRNPTRRGYQFLGWYKDARFASRVYSINKGTAGNLTLYAKWQVINYPVKYVLNGGVQHKGNTATYNVAGRALYVPARRGYAFTGWYLDEALTERIMKIEAGTVGTLTLYAGWEIAHYNINYYLNGGENADRNPATYTMLDETIPLAYPTRLGHKFLGWYKDAKFYTRLYNVPKNSVGNVNAYARWQVINYPVKYVLNGGTQHRSNGATYNVYGHALYNPARKGYAFTGWYLDAELTEPIAKIEPGTTEALTLYAGWEIVDYTINYVLNGGENNEANPTDYTVGTETIWLQNPTRLGYKFLGWYTNAKFQTKVTSIAKGNVGNRTLYARWQAVPYTVRYMLNGGAQHKSNTATYTVAGRALYNPARKGFNFTGWYADEALTERWANIPAGTTGTITLYAGWEVAHYSLNYANMRDTDTNPNPASYTMFDETIWLQTPSRTGFRFLGWYADARFYTKVTNIAKGSVNNRTLYARWQAVPYPVSYVLNGGVQHKSNASTYTIDGRALYNPSRKGYAFTGWYRDAALTERWEKIPAGLMEPITLYAGWEVANYTIAYKNMRDTDENPNRKTYTMFDATFGLSNPSRVGYRFLGWYKDARFYTRMGNIAKGTVGTVTVYAKWQAYTYPVSYVLNGGTQHKSNIATYTVDGRALYAPSRKGYAFTGWYADAELTERWESIPAGKTEPITLYAGWEIVDYTIDYVLNGGTNADANPATYRVDTATFWLASPERLGYKFLGWYKESSFYNKVASVVRGTAGNLRLFARWQAIPYKVSYVLNGGTQNTKNSATYTVAGRALYAPTRRGYTFTGWYFDANLTQKAERIPAGTTGPLTLYAGWW
ncbi:MAG: leucine-rich repeat protein [Clostridia bacterium]|nr:leucine-rich repeat protein [Clostridia bacterium]